MKSTLFIGYGLLIVFFFINSRQNSLSLRADSFDDRFQKDLQKPLIDADKDEILEQPH